jgi:WD40 repeat protein
VAVPLAERVVEVIADLGEGAKPRYRYGSGCIVRERTALTAAHVVAGAVAVQVRRPDKVRLAARADAQFVGGGSGPDLALVHIDDDRLDLEPIELAVVDRDSPTAAPVEGCHVVGYPQFRDTPRGGRETTDAYGHVPVLAGLVSGLLTVEVTASPRPLPPGSAALGNSEWSGMSGAPVVADGCLLGVVSEHAPREGPSAITAVPLSALEAEPAHPGWGPGVSNATEWWAQLGVSGLQSLRRLPARKTRPEPAYWATVREIHGRTPQLLDRGRDLAEISVFAAGAKSYLWLVGGAWAGKTALMAEVCTAARPPTADVVAYFLSRREADADSNRFLAAVVPQLAYLLDVDTPVPSLQEFRNLWSRAADGASKTGRQLLLVVDGLDEDLRPAGLPSVAALLPAEPGASAHVLVTSRPYPELPGDIPAGHPLRTPAVELAQSPNALQLADLARQEIYDLLHREDQELTVGVLGTLTAAAGPLAIGDLARLTSDGRPVTAARTLQVRRLVTEKAARALQPVGPANDRRYQFAHGSLLEQAQADESLSDPEYRRQIYQWADQWRDAGWPTEAGAGGPTPVYLLDSYPSTLKGQPQRLTALTGDVGWIVAALLTAGVDKVLADMRTAQSAGAASAQELALLTAVRSQAPNLRLPPPVDQRGYVLRQLCQQAAELGDDRLATDARALLQAMPGPVLMPVWTTRRASRALVVELGHDGGDVMAVASLRDGRVASGSSDGRVRVWDPRLPGAAAIELDGHRGDVRAVAGLPDGRVVFGGNDARLEMWDPAMTGDASVELGREDLRAVVVLPDGRVVSGSDHGRVLVWDPAAPGGDPVVLGRQDGDVRALAVLPDGRVIAGGIDGRVDAWDPAAPGGDPVVLGRQDGDVRALAVLPDGRVVSGGGDGRMWLWAAAVPGAGPVEFGCHGSFLASLTAMQDGRVVSGGADGRVLVWDPAEPGGDPVRLGGHDGGVWTLAGLPDGRVVSGGADGRVRVWDPAAAGPAEPGRHGDEVSDEVRALAMLPDGRVVFGGSDRRVLVWDPATPGTGPEDLGGHDGGLWALAVLPDGRVVAGDSTGKIDVRNPVAPGADPVPLGRGLWVAALAVLGDGRVVSAGGGQLRMWNPAVPGADPVDLGGWDLTVTEVVALPDGRVVSGGSDGRLRIWDPRAPGSEPAELGRHGEQVSAVAVLADGRVVSSGSGGKINVWDPAAPGVGPLELGHPDSNVRTVAALSEGRVASGGRDGQLRVWDVAGGVEIALAACYVTMIASAPGRATDDHLLIAHRGQGVSLWSVRTSKSP